MIIDLSNKNILITGASGGIGRACAIDCSRAGARVHIVGRNHDRLMQTYEQLSGEGNSYHEFDLFNFDGYAELITGIVAQFGRIDGFIHSAGIQYMLPFQHTLIKEYMDSFTINTVSAFELSRIITQKKNVSETGLRILFIASVMSIVGASCQTSYCASKAALVGGARIMAVELASRKVLVNCISPGSLADTELANLRNNLSEEGFNNIVSEHLLGLGKTEDVSALCVFLMSEKGKWITGQNFVVDGGYSAK